MLGIQIYSVLGKVSWGILVARCWYCGWTATSARFLGGMSSCGSCKLKELSICDLSFQNLKAHTLYIGNKIEFFWKRKETTNHIAWVPFASFSVDLCRCCELADLFSLQVSLLLYMISCHEMDQKRNDWPSKKSFKSLPMQCWQCTLVMVNLEDCMGLGWPVFKIWEKVSSAQIVFNNPSSFMNEHLIISHVMVPYKLGGPRFVGLSYVVG